MKILFVEPKGAYSNVFDKIMTIPLLGPVYLATIANNDGLDASVFNENISGRITPELLKSVDVLGLSCITPTISRGEEIAKEYKSIRGDLESRVIIGGIHASMMPNEVSEFEYFDQVVVGEAENVILDILKGNITDEIFYAERPENLDDLPLPDLSLIEDSNKIKTLPVMGSRGCPYDCNFCSVTEMFGRGYRAQSPDKLIEEISRYEKKVFFSDDHFAANPKRTNEIFDMMIETGFNRPWSAQLRADVAKNSGLLAKMKKAGCETVYVGLESINPQSLKEMNKKQTVEDIHNCINMFHDNGIMVHGMFMFGNDSDTKDTFKETSEFCYNSGIDFAQFLALTPVPGTRLYRKFKEEGRLLHENYQLYDGLHVVFRPNQMTVEELQQGVIDCFKDFYSYSKGIRSFLKTVGTIARTAFTNVHLPSFHPSFMKFIGSGIIKRWMEYNKDFLADISNLSSVKSEIAKV